MKVELLTKEGLAVLTNQNGESMKISIPEFWQICQFGARLDTQEEVSALLSDVDAFEGIPTELLKANSAFVAEVVDRVLDTRVQNETGSQVYDAVCYCIKNSKEMNGCTVWHGDVDVPFGFCGLEKTNHIQLEEEGARFLMASLNFVTEFNDVTVEGFGHYMEGCGFSFSFTTGLPDDMAAFRLQQALEGLKFEAYSEVRQPSIDKTLADAKEKSALQGSAKEMPAIEQGDMAR